MSSESLPLAPDLLRVSVVIPAKNEAKNLPYVLTGMPVLVSEVLLIDGNSTDDTVATAQQLLPTIRVITQTGRGKGNALQAGFEAATGDIVVMMDADGSMNPAEISRFVEALLAGADYAKGSRFMQQGGSDDITWFRFSGNWCFTKLVRLLFGGNYSDLCYGYNAFWRIALPYLDTQGDGFEIETLLNISALRANLQIVEVPSIEAPRQYGSSHLRPIRDGIRILRVIWNQWKAHRNKSPHSSSMSTLVLSKPLVHSMKSNLNSSTALRSN